MGRVSRHEEGLQSRCAGKDKGLKLLEDINWAKLKSFICKDYSTPNSITNGD